MATETLPKPPQDAFIDIEKWHREGHATPDEFEYAKYLLKRILNTSSPLPILNGQANLTPIVGDLQIPLPASPQTQYPQEQQPTQKRTPNSSLSPLEKRVFDYLKDRRGVKGIILERDLDLKHDTLSNLINSLRKKLPLQDTPLFLLNLSPHRQPAEYILVTEEESDRIKKAQETARARTEVILETQEGKNQEKVSLLSRDAIIMAEAGHDLPNIRSASEDSEIPGIFAPVSDFNVKIPQPLPMIVVEGTNGRFQVKRKDLPLFKAIQAGKTQTEIIEQLYSGDKSHYYAVLESLKDSLLIAGLQVVSTQGGTITITEIIRKQKNSTPERTEVRNYLDLSSEDIQQILINPLHAQQLLPVDITIFDRFVELAREKRRVNDFDLYKIQIDPTNKLPQDLREKILLLRLGTINDVVDFGELKSPEYARKRLEEAIKADNILYPQETFKLLRKLDATRRSVVIAIHRSDGQITQPIIFQPTGKDSITAPNAKKEKGGVVGDENKGTISASVQLRAFEILFQNDPVPLTFLRSRLGGEIDTVKDTGDVLRLVDEKIHAWGIGIEVYIEEKSKGISFDPRQQMVKLTMFKPGKHLTPYLEGEEVDLEAEKAALPIRQRRRKPSHGGVKI